MRKNFFNDQRKVVHIKLYEFQNGIIVKTIVKNIQNVYHVP